MRLRNEWHPAGVIYGRNRRHRNGTTRKSFWYRRALFVYYYKIAAFLMIPTRFYVYHVYGVYEYRRGFFRVFSRGGAAARPRARWKSARRQNETREEKKDFAKLREVKVMRTVREKETHARGRERNGERRRRREGAREREKGTPGTHTG